MEEMIVLPVKEAPEVVQWYKGELTGNALLSRAGHLAAKKKRILADKTLNASETVQRVKPISKALRNATKRLRQIPGGSVEPPGGEEEEDEGLVSSAMEKWMKRMVQNTRPVRVKVEPHRRLPVTPRRRTPQPSRIPLFKPSPTPPPQDQGARPKTVPKKKKPGWKSRMAKGMASAALEGAYKGGTRSGKPYQTGNGWEEW